MFYCKALIFKVLTILQPARLSEIDVAVVRSDLPAQLVRNLSITMSLLSTTGVKRKNVTPATTTSMRPRTNNNVREKSTDSPDMIFIATPLYLQPHDLLSDVAQILSLVVRETAVD